jgi:hypothetical protein
MNNPYEAPRDDDVRSAAREAARTRVFPVAVAIIVLAILDMFTNSMAVAFNVWRAMEPGMGNEGRDLLMYSTYNGIHAIAMLPIVFGAISMVRLRSYLWSMVVVWLVVIPFLSPCFITAIPFGIWGIAVLRDPAVRSAFLDERPISEH